MSAAVQNDVRNVSMDSTTVQRHTRQPKPLAGLGREGRNGVSHIYLQLWPEFEQLRDDDVTYNLSFSLVV